MIISLICNYESHKGGRIHFYTLSILPSMHGSVMFRDLVHLIIVFRACTLEACLWSGKEVSGQRWFFYMLSSRWQSVAKQNRPRQMLGFISFHRCSGKWMCFQRSFGEALQPLAEKQLEQVWEGFLGVCVNQEYVSTSYKGDLTAPQIQASYG